MSTLGSIQVITQALHTLGSTSQSTADQVEASAKRIVESHERAATRADDLLYEMQRLADEGNAWAEQLEGVIRQVQEGLIDKKDAIYAFGDGVVMFEGQLRSVKDVLADVLPAAGDVQDRIRALREEIKEGGSSIDAITQRLSQQSNSYARELANIVRLVQQGRMTAEALLRRAQEIQRMFPGSETAELAELLEEGLRDGSFT